MALRHVGAMVGGMGGPCFEGPKGVPAPNFRPRPRPCSSQREAHRSQTAGVGEGRVAAQGTGRRASLPPSHVSSASGPRWRASRRGWRRPCGVRCRRTSSFGKRSSCRSRRSPSRCRRCALRRAFQGRATEAWVRVPWGRGMASGARARGSFWAKSSSVRKVAQVSPGGIWGLWQCSVCVWQRKLCTGAENFPFRNCPRQNNPHTKSSLTPAPPAHPGVFVMTAYRALIRPSGEDAMGRSCILDSPPGAGGCPRQYGGLQQYGGLLVIAEGSRARGQ